MTEPNEGVVSETPLLSVKNLRKEFGGLVAVKDVSFEVR
jgi:ABC-type branched-subunit amino acid transport system ATPase component